MRVKERPAIRIASWATILAGAAAFVNPHVTDSSWAAIWAGWALGGLLVVFSAVHLWTARRGRPLFGSRLLSLFNVTLGVALATHGFIMRLAPAYAWTTAVLGAVVIVAEVFDAVVSPGSRWQRVGPA